VCREGKRVSPVGQKTYVEGGQGHCLPSMIDLSRYAVVINALLFTAGSIPFVPASVLFYPTFASDDTLYLVAVWGFIGGSTFFLIAGLQNAITAIVRACSPKPEELGTHPLLLDTDPLEEHLPEPFFKTLFLKTLPNSTIIPIVSPLLSTFGATLFLIGSAAFLPQVSCPTYCGVA